MAPNEETLMATGPNGDISAERLTRLRTPEAIDETTCTAEDALLNVYCACVYAMDFRRISTTPQIDKKIEAHFIHWTS